jgi:hypothetical protein
VRYKVYIWQALHSHSRTEQRHGGCHDPSFPIASLRIFGERRTYYLIRMGHLVMGWTGIIPAWYRTRVVVVDCDCDCGCGVKNSDTIGYPTAGLASSLSVQPADWILQLIYSAHHYPPARRCRYGTHSHRHTRAVSHPHPSTTIDTTFSRLDTKP